MYTHQKNIYIYIYIYTHALQKSYLTGHVYMYVNMLMIYKYL